MSETCRNKKKEKLKSTSLFVAICITAPLTIEVASVIELSEASGRVAAGLFMIYQIYPPTIDTIVTGLPLTTNLPIYMGT